MSLAIIRHAGDADRETHESLAVKNKRIARNPSRTLQARPGVRLGGKRLSSNREWHPLKLR